MKHKNDPILVLCFAMLLISVIAILFQPWLGPSGDPKLIGELIISLASAVATAAAVGVAVWTWKRTQDDLRQIRQVQAEITCTSLFEQVCNAVVAGDDMLYNVEKAGSPETAGKAVTHFINERNAFPEILLIFDDAALARVADFRPDIAGEIRLGAAQLRAARSRLLNFNGGDFRYPAYNEPELADWKRLLTDGTARLKVARDLIESFAGINWKDSVNASWGRSPQFARPWMTKA